MSTVPRFALVAPLALALAGPATAQSIIGRVLDDASDSPLAATSVMLLDSAGVTVDVALSDSTGWFALLPPGPGDYTVFVDRMAYEVLVSPAIEMGAGSTAELELRMIAVPLELEGISVSTERRRLRLEERGFYRRRDAGAGYFFAPDEIRDYDPLYTTDLFRQVPGARIRPMPGSFGSMVSFRGLGRGCQPRFVLNGWPLDLGGLSVDELVHPADIMAVEVFPGGTGAPIRYVGFGARCGVVMIWTY